MDKNPFKGKKVTIMGLGLLGGALNDAVFLAEHGAELTVTDLKTEEELKDSVSVLKNLKTNKPIHFYFGGHRMEDFQNADFILQPGNAPLGSSFLAEARKNNIPIYVSESLFAEYSEATLVGVTGTRGKSTTTHMIYEVLKKNPPQQSKIFLGGNVKNVSTLSLLDEAKRGDIVVLEFDSWALHGMGEIKKSPHVAVFTTFFNDHLNYYKGDVDLYLEDKAQIFKYQTAQDVLIVGEQVAEFVSAQYKTDIKSRVIIAKIKKDLELSILGEHNIYNASCAYEALRVLGLDDKTIKKGLRDFKGLSGRLEFVREVNGVKIYNDTTSTTPEATMAALSALHSQLTTNNLQQKNIVLIMGGADKGLNMTKLIEEIPKYCKKVILLPGTGTEKLISNFKFPMSNKKVETLNEAVNLAISEAQNGDIILFSPAFASFGMFKNEFDRGEKFLEEVAKL